MSFFSRAIVAIALTLAATPGPASAQEPGIPVPLADLSAGYVFMHGFTDIGPEVDDTHYPAGWYFSGAFNPTTWFGIVGEVSGSYRNGLETEYYGFGSSTDARVYAYMAGARFFKKSGRLVPFVQFLAGIAHLRATVHVTPAIPELGSTIEAGTNDLALQPGGGLTVYLTERVGVRMAADYRAIIDVVDADNDSNHQFRMLAGFTLQWGGR